MGHFEQLSLLHGWLPAAVQVLALLVAVSAIDWRRRRWRRWAFPVALIVAAAVTALAYWYIASIGVAGDPAPASLWLWIAMSGLAAAVLLLGWPGARWWRRGAGGAFGARCARCARAWRLNVWVGYFPTVLAAWNQLTSGPLPDQIDRLRVTAMQVEGTKPTKGVVVPVNIDADASHFPHRQELVYLPPAWFSSNPPPRLPTVMMISSAFNTPADWLRAGGAFDTIDDFAAHHHGFAPALVFVDPTGSFDNDTECVNGSRGNAADHLTKDVVPFMVSQLRGERRPGQLGRRRMVDGRYLRRRPDRHASGRVQRVRRHRRRHPPQRRRQGPNHRPVVRRQSPPPGPSSTRSPSSLGTAATPGCRDGSTSPHRPVRTTVAQAANPTVLDSTDPVANPEGQDAAANSLCDIAAANGINCAVVTQPGKHDWPFAAQAFAAALPWLAATLGTPEVEPVPVTAAGQRGTALIRSAS